MFVEKKRSACSQYTKAESDFIEQEEEEDVMCFDIDISESTKNQYRNNSHQTSASNRMRKFECITIDNLNLKYNEFLTVCSTHSRRWSIWPSGR